MKLSARQRALLSFGVAALLLALLFGYGGVDPVEAGQTLLQLSPATYLVALGLHLAAYCLRAWRFQLLIPSSEGLRFRPALSIAAAHNLASYVLPLKAGEASLIVYLKLHCGTPSATSLAALLVSRFLDGAALCSGLAWACLSTSGTGPGALWLESASLVLAPLTLLFLLLSLRGDLLVRALERSLRWFRIHRWRMGERLLLRTNGVALALRVAGGKRRLLAAGLVTLPLWFALFGFDWVLARAFGVPAELSFLDCTLGASLATLFNLLPINAAAGAGTQELGWVTGFHGALGVDERVALTSAIGVHLVQLVNIVLLGLLAHVALGVSPRWRFPRPDPS